MGSGEMARWRDGKFVVRRRGRTEFLTVQPPPQGRRSQRLFFPIFHIADYCTWLREQRERMTNQQA
jgi:hypothetical protein